MAPLLHPPPTPLLPISPATSRPRAAIAVAVYQLDQPCRGYIIGAFASPSPHSSFRSVAPSDRFGQQELPYELAIRSPPPSRKQLAIGSPPPCKQHHTVEEPSAKCDEEEEEEEVSSKHCEEHLQAVRNLNEQQEAGLSINCVGIPQTGNECVVDELKGENARMKGTGIHRGNGLARQEHSERLLQKVGLDMEIDRNDEMNEGAENEAIMEGVGNLNGYDTKEKGLGYSDDGLDMEPPDVDEVFEPITRIPVPRQKYIPVSKVSLIKSLADAFDNKKKASEFLITCSFLDYVLHAEHKTVLEQLRLDYKVTRSALKESQTDDARRNSRLRWKWGWIRRITEAWIKRRRASDSSKQASFASADGSSNGAPFGPSEAEPQVSSLLAMSNGNSMPESSLLSKEHGSIRNSSIAAAARFQRNFLKLLRNAQFQGLSARDLQLTSALNTDYLLTLPIEVDWKRATSENAIVFRRGYASEKQEGLLFGAKLDYLQSRVLLKTFNWFSRPLFRVGAWINKQWKNVEEKDESKRWAEGFKEWLKEPLKPGMDDDLSGISVEAFFEQENEGDLPIWIAAQQAVPRYEAFLSSAGSRGMLLRRILVWMRILPAKPAKASIVSGDKLSTAEPHIRGSYLSRISMRDIWLPASRVVCGGNAWQRLQAALKIFFSRTTLQEPAFRELVLLYNVPDNLQTVDEQPSIPNLHLKIYGKIPIPDLKVIFPNKKLSFRILDTVRLDVATVVGLFAFLVNYRFDDFLSSPSAFLLDIIATSALIVYMTKVVLGYKQTYDRYQLLVNKTLHEKTLASKFGAVHFLVDASQQQQFKEAILAFAVLSQAKGGQVDSPKILAGRCERFMLNQFKEQVEMPIDDALKTLLRLGLVVMHDAKREHHHKDSNTIRAVPHEQLLSILEDSWKNLLLDHSLWIDFMQSIHDGNIN